MSVINRLEVANFLNLNNIAPTQQGWKPDYIHLVMNFRGQSTAVVATNGMGKSTINRAIYAILTREPSFCRQVKSVAAPKRIGAYSHIRLEVLFQDRAVGNLFGRIGADVPGEPYVFGVYGNCDGDLIFYTYQGRLEDCPIATHNGSRVQIAANQEFRETLRSRQAMEHNPTKEEWWLLIGKHFDLAMLDQLVAYQKSGGGDSAEDFFKVKQRPINGHMDPYDSAFFYEFIAPEILANAMYGEDKDNSETRFEDTILKSATPLISAEMSCDRLKVALDKDKTTFAVIEKVNDHLTRFTDERKRLDGYVDELAAEVGFILDVTQHRPLPGVPLVLTGRGEQTNLIANSLVLADGEWMVPDSLLAGIWATDPAHVNQLADRHGIAGAKSRQVVDIPWDLKIGRDARGQPNRSYALADALRLLDYRTSWADGWTRDSAKRALNLGHEYRRQEGDTNLFRHRLAEIHQVLATNRQDQVETETARDSAEKQLIDLNSRIESLQADEHELSQIRASGLFTGAELSDLATLATATRMALSTAIAAREAHERRHVALAQDRQKFATASTVWPDIPPGAVLEQLVEAVDLASDDADGAKTRRQDADLAEQETAKARQQAETAYEQEEREKAKLDAMIEPVERFERAFPGESPVGLEMRVQADYDEAQSTLGKTKGDISKAHEEQGNLLKLEPSWRDFRASFPDVSDPTGLEGQIIEALAKTKARQTEVFGELTRIEAKTAELSAGQTAMRTVVDTGEPDVVGLETRLRADRDTVSQLFQQNKELLNKAEADDQALRVFAGRFPEQLPSAVRLQRQQELPMLAKRQAEVCNLRDDANRQLEELKSASTAAGRIASEVLRAIGGRPSRVYEVINEFLAQDDPRREPVLMHFSHVLHAPVAKNADEARAILHALQTAKLEAPVFVYEFIEKLCNSTSVAIADGLATAALAGIKTLQVEGLLDPRRIEEQRLQLKQVLEQADENLAVVTEQLDELADTSETSKIVRLACDAEERALVIRLGELRQAVSNDSARLSYLESFLTGSMLQTVKVAERYLASGGDNELARQLAFDASLRAELSELTETTLPRLEAHRNQLPVVKRAVQFHDAGGECRLQELAAKLVSLDETKTRIEASLPRLIERRNAIPDIRAAENFHALGGREALAQLIARLNTLHAAREHVRTTYSSRRAAALKASEAERHANAALADAKLKLAEARPTLEAALRYLSEGGLEFDATYETVRDTLLEAESRCHRRADFRFGAARRAYEAEMSGTTATYLGAKRAHHQAEMDAAKERLRQLHNAERTLSDRRNKVQGYVEKLDRAVAGLLERRRQARQAVVDADLTPERIDAAPRSPALHRVSTFTQNVREGIALGEEAEEDIVEAIEEITNDTAEFSLQTRIVDIRACRDQKDRHWRDYERSLQQLRTNTGLSLAESDRALLAEAEKQSGIHRVIEIMRTFDLHLGKAQQRYDTASEDIRAQKDQLAKSLNAFTLRIKDNFALLRSCLKPTSSRDAGFEIEASIIERNEILDAVERVISMLRVSADARAKQEELNVANESLRDYEERMRNEIRGIFYRAVFTGVGGDDVRKKVPRIFIYHPHIGGGQRKRLDKKISTGQRNALGLLFMTKMADFAISRDERFDLANTGRRHAATTKTRVVMIDGLFSNVSNRALIRESLDAMRDLRGKFQLIGWIHNEAYENDPEIFPEYIALRRIGATEGFVVIDQTADAIGEPLLAGNVGLVEMHVDPANEEVLQ